MAGQTSRGAVGTCQGETGPRVIEWFDLLPSGGDVAILARRAKLPPVRIDAPVAVRALRRYAAIVVGRAVAARAVHPGVRAGQRIVGQRVVKGGTVQPDQPKAAPFVLAVAGFAGLGACRCEFAMKPALAGDVGTHPAVAGHAFAILRFLAERGVAAIAAAFQPDMAGAERPGGDQALHNRLGRDAAGHARSGDDQAQQQEKRAQPWHQYMCTATIWSVAAAISRKNSGKWNKCHSRSIRS